LSEQQLLEQQLEQLSEQQLEQLSEQRSLSSCMGFREESNSHFAI
jgi:hypothetical protein